MFTGSDPRIIRRMQNADTIAIETAARLNRALYYEVTDKRSTLLVPVRKPARSAPGLPLLRLRACA